MDEERTPCLEPRVVLLLVTVAVTTAATGMLCAAIMTDHWEHISWDRSAVERLATAANLTNTQVIVEWFLKGRVTHISVREYHRDNGYQSEDGPELASLYLVPMYGGIWTLCLALDDEERRLMKSVGFPDTGCINYLETTTVTNERPFGTFEEPRADWQHRMQNLSISCALVCLIILGSSALVGAFGVLKHQISAVLVTGVMYLLAATFALFTLAIIHFKRRSGREDDCGPKGSSDGVVLGPGGESYSSLWRPYLAARVFTPAWSLDLGWAALGVCAAASTLWILLAKVMRYTPITTILA